MDQTKIVKLLRLTKMMSGNDNYTIDALMEQLDIIALDAFGTI